MTQIGDSISIECACGKRLKAPATAVGRKAKCPKCGNVMTITAPPPPPVEDDALGAIYDLAESERAAAGNQTDDAPSCPKCAASMNSGAVLWENCGYDLRTRSNLAAPVATAPKPVIDLDAAKSAKKPIDRLAPEGSFLAGLLVSAGFATLGGIIWFFVTWGTGRDFYILCVLIGILAGAGMRAGQKGVSMAGGWGAAGVSLVVLILARFAVVVAILIPMLKDRLEHTPAPAPRSSPAQLASARSSGTSNTSPALASPSTAAPAAAHHSLGHAVGALVIALIFFGWKSTIFMILTLIIAFRRAAGSVST